MSTEPQPKSKFAKDAKEIIFGSLGARAIGLITLPVITRLYSPQDFAVFSVFVALITIAVPFATLHYTAAIPVARSNNTALALMRVSFTSTVLSAVLLMGLLHLVFYTVPMRGAVAELRPYLYLVPVGVVFVGIWECLNYWGARRRAFKLIAQGLFRQSLGGAIVKIALGFMGIVPFGLLAGQIVAQGGGGGFLYKRFADDLRGLWIWNSPRSMWRLMRAYWRYPVLAMPSLLLNALVMQLPTLYIAMTFDVEKTGNFGLAWTTLLIPMRLLAKPISQVYYAHSAGLGRGNATAIQSLLVTTGWRLLLVLIPANVVLYFVAAPLFPVIFGAKWVLAGQLLGILSLFFTVQFLYSVLNQMLNVINRQDIRLKLELQNVVLVLALFSGAAYFEVGFITTVQGYSGVMLLHFTFSIGRILAAIWYQGRSELATDTTKVHQ